MAPLSAYANRFLPTKEEYESIHRGATNFRETEEGEEYEEEDTAGAAGRTGQSMEELFGTQVEEGPFHSGADAAEAGETSENAAADDTPENNASISSLASSPVNTRLWGMGDRGEWGGRTQAWMSGLGRRGLEIDSDDEDDGSELRQQKSAAAASDMMEAINVSQVDLSRLVHGKRQRDSGVGRTPLRIDRRRQQAPPPNPGLGSLAEEAPAGEVGGSPRATETVLLERPEPAAPGTDTRKLSDAQPLLQGDQIEERGAASNFSSRFTLPGFLRGKQDFAWVLLLIGCVAWTVYNHVDAVLTRDGPGTHVHLSHMLGTISMMAVLSCGGTTAALFYLVQSRNYSIGPLVAASVYAAPVSLVVTAIMSWSRALEEDHSPYSAMLVAIGLFAFGGALNMLAFGVRRKHKRVTEIITVACDVLYAHEGLVAVSSGASVVTCILTVYFVAAIRDLALQGSFVSTGAAILTWMWLVQVSRAIQRATVSGVCAAWWAVAENDGENTEPMPGAYLEPREEEEQQPLVEMNLRRAASLLLGTCIGSAFAWTIIEPLKTAALLRNPLSVATQTLASFITGTGGLGFLFVPVAFVLAFVLRIVLVFISQCASFAHWLSSWTLCFAGVTGKPLWQSSQGARSLLNDDKTIVHIGDILTVRAVVLNWGTTLASALAACALVTIDLPTGDFASRAVSFIVLLFAFIVPWFCTKLALGLVLDTADTLYLLYNVDVCTGQRHRLRVQAAFE